MFRLFRKRIGKIASLKPFLICVFEGSTLLYLHLAVVQRLAAGIIAISPSTRLGESLIKTDQSTRTPSVPRQALVLVSKCCQHCSSRRVTENNLTCSRILKTLLSVKASSKNRQHLSARAEVMYFFAK